MKLSDCLPGFVIDGFTETPIEQSGDENDADECRFAPAIEKEA
jgi:hypothetical protein